MAQGHTADRSRIGLFTQPFLDLNPPNGFFFFSFKISFFLILSEHKGRKGKRQREEKNLKLTLC